MNAQSIQPSLINTSGDSFTSETTQLDWSLGEVMIETFSNANTVLTQGLHQPEITLVASIKDNLMSISIYPNPASEFVGFQTEYPQYPKLKILIHDASGKLMLENTINTRGDLLDISELDDGVYYLYVYGNGTILNTSKLIKQN